MASIAEDVAQRLETAIVDRDILLQLYIPNADSDGNALPDHDSWVGRAEMLLSESFGGATRPTDVHGLWKNPDTNSIIRERTAIVYTYVSEQKLYPALDTLKLFLHAFGHMTKQGEVAFVLDGCLYGITEYDSSLLME